MRPSIRLLYFFGTALGVLFLPSGCSHSDEPPPFAIQHRYATDFELAERPISEGGVWHHTGNAFTEVQTENGIAHGTNGVRNTYDDSYALLSGFGPDQSATATVRRSGQLADKVTHEVELLLRMTDDSSGARGYECLFAFHGGVQIMRWNGPMGSFTDLGVQEGRGRFRRALKSGDDLKATIVGNTISLYVNGTLVGRSSDSTFASGQPGIGFFTRPGGSSANFGLESYAVVSN